MRASPRLLSLVGATAALAALVALPGCFNPKLEPGFGCGEEAQCPDGFFCDQVIWTCQRDGTPPTPGAVELGPMQRGPVAARLGDNLVIAGWVPAPSPSTSKLQVRTHDKLGRPVGEVRDVREFDDVDRKSLRAAGSDNAVVIAGRLPSGRLQIAWVTAGDLTPASPPDPYEAFTVTGSAQFACYAAGRTPAPATSKSVIDIGCSNGTPTTVRQYTAPNRQGFISLAAGVADDHTEAVVIAEMPPQLANGPHDLYAFCPSQPAPLAPFAMSPAQGDSLQPQVFYSPGNSLVHVGWKAATVLRTAKLNWPSCTSPGGENGVGTSATTAFAMVGRAQSTGWAGPAGVWSLDLHGGDAPKPPSIGDWMTSADTPFTVEHQRLTNPHALTTKDNEPWFFLHAADAVPSQGFFKYTSLESMGRDVRYLESALVTPDFAVARRNAGSFFLVYREDADGVGEDAVLPAYLAIFDAAGDLEPPPPAN